MPEIQEPSTETSRLLLRRAALESLGKVEKGNSQKGKLLLLPLQPRILASLAFLFLVREAQVVSQAQSC